MKLLSPYTLDLTTGIKSSSIAEDDYPLWGESTDYVIKDRVVRTATHKVYESITGGVSATPPEDALGGDTPEWIVVKSTNRWSMFNDLLTDFTTSNNDITTTVNTGSIEGVALLGLVGSQATVTITDKLTTETIFTETREIDGSVVADISDWFFVDPEYNADIVFQGIPIGFTEVELTINIEKGSDSAGCGVCKFGTIDFIGDTLHGASISIVDYSVETVDSFGYLQITERGFIKAISSKMITTKANFSKIFKLVSRRRAIPTVYITTDASGYEPLIAYGLFHDFTLDISYSQYNYCTLVVHGVVQE